MSNPYFVFSSYGKNNPNCWAVSARDNSTYLGKVELCLPWRKFCFLPSMGTAFDANCLREIAEFCDNQMKKRKHEK